jgi:preprotein translocase subunit YajC
MNDQVISFIFKVVLILAIIIVSVMFTLALEKKQRDQHEKDMENLKGGESEN